ncbi:MAG: tRNA (N6-isopentenyl adenosine(37)-C2)-methylthiotransferase MiaB [Deltaproteobacteria bacterium]
MTDKEIKKNKVFLRTFGCQMNVRDSEAVRGLLAAEGYGWTEDPREADVVLFNTCSVRQHAEDKVWSEIGRVARCFPKSQEPTAKSRKRPLIGIIGCMAQNYKEEIRRRAPQVDVVCGPSEIDNIALYLEEALRKKGSIVAVQERRRREEMYHTGFRQEKDHAYVVISEGCDNFCSYCVVPYVRGRLRHRPAQEILKEAGEAVAAGLTSVTLLGQNVNSYVSEGRGTRPPSAGRGEGRRISFVELLERAANIEGLGSLSFITCHPKDTKVALFRLMSRRPKIRPYLHMPFQAGSDKILRRMGRGYTARRYLALVGRYRGLVPNGKLSTDVIVGFPGETEADFAATRRLMERVRFDTAYIFKYSPRPHTRAACLKDDVPMGVKKRRHAELLELQKSISRIKRRAEEGGSVGPQ